MRRRRSPSPRYGKVGVPALKVGVVVVRREHQENRHPIQRGVNFTQGDAGGSGTVRPGAKVEGVVRSAVRVGKVEGQLEPGRWQQGRPELKGRAIVPIHEVLGVPLPVWSSTPDGPIDRPPCTGRATYDDFATGAAFVCLPVAVVIYLIAAAFRLGTDTTLTGPELAVATGLPPFFARARADSARPLLTLLARARRIFIRLTIAIVVNRVAAPLRLGSDRALTVAILTVSAGSCTRLAGSDVSAARDLLTFRAQTRRILVGNSIAVVVDSISASFLSLRLAGRADVFYPSKATGDGDLAQACAAYEITEFLISIPVTVVVAPVAGLQSSGMERRAPDLAIAALRGSCGTLSRCAGGASLSQANNCVVRASITIIVQSVARLLLRCWGVAVLPIPCSTRLLSWPACTLAVTNQTVVHDTVAVIIEAVAGLNFSGSNRRLAIVAVEVDATVHECAVSIVVNTRRGLDANFTLAGSLVTAGNSLRLASAFLLVLGHLLFVTLADNIDLACRTNLIAAIGEALAIAPRPFSDEGPIDFARAGATTFVDDSVAIVILSVARFNMGLRTGTPASSLTGLLPPARPLAGTGESLVGQVVAVVILAVASLRLARMNARIGIVAVLTKVAANPVAIAVRVAATRTGVLGVWSISEAESCRRVALRATFGRAAEQGEVVKPRRPRGASKLDSESGIVPNSPSRKLNLNSLPVRY